MFNRSYIYSHKDHPHYINDSRILRLKKTTALSDNDVLTNIIRNLSDPTKMQIYLLLEKVEEISVKDIAFVLGLSHSAVSHALSDLKTIGIVKCRRCGKLICYSLNKSKKKNKILEFLSKFK